MEEFDEYRTEINSFTSTKDEAGKDVKGEAKKDKTMAYIDSLPISLDQKDFLYLLNYKESTLFTDAPWYKYAGQLPTAENGFRNSVYSQVGMRNNSLRDNDGIRGKNVFGR